MYILPLVFSSSIGCFNAVMSLNVHSIRITWSFSFRMGAIFSNNHRGDPEINKFQTLFFHWRLTHFRMQTVVKWNYWILRQTYVIFGYHARITLRPIRKNCRVRKIRRDSLEVFVAGQMLSYHIATRVDPKKSIVYNVYYFQALCELRSTKKKHKAISVVPNESVIDLIGSSMLSKKSARQFC